MFENACKQALCGVGVGERLLAWEKKEKGNTNRRQLLQQFTTVVSIPISLTTVQLYATA